MINLSPANARHFWIGLMTVASTLTTLVLACATPFPALAALAATHIRRSEGIMLMLAAWIMSQAVGFCLLDYPLNANSVAWSIALGTAAIGSLLAADAVAARLRNARPVARLSAAYVTAYVGFKGVVLLWSFTLNDGWAAFSAEILARQFVRYGVILLGLLFFHRVLSTLGIRTTNTRSSVSVSLSLRSLPPA